MKRLMITAAMSAFVISAPFAVSAGEAMHHTGHHGSAAPKAKQCKYANKSPSVKAYKTGMDKMHAEMMAVKDTGNVDVDFTRGMIPHHQGAVEMAKVELQYGKDPAMRALAQNILTNQQAEIGMMKRWLQRRGQVPANQKPNKEAIEENNAAMHTMHKEMNIAYTGNPDLDFVNGMIPHHQGAVDMAWVVVRHGQDPEIVAFTREVIEAQTNEIALMQSWRDNYTESKK